LLLVKKCTAKQIKIKILILNFKDVQYFHVINIVPNNREYIMICISL